MYIWLENSYSYPQIRVLGLFDLLNGLQYQWKPKMHTLVWVCIILTMKHEYLAIGLTFRSVN